MLKQHYANKTPKFDSRGSESYRYGAIDPEEFSEEEDRVGDEFEPLEFNTKTAPNRRWSVLEKLDRQYNGRDRTCCGLFRNITKKCVFATVMLTAFIVLAWYFTRTLLFNIELNPQLYDFIVVGGGPSGSVVTRRLLDEGASVLLLEAGEHTQYVIDDSDRSAYTTTADLNLATDNSISEFDIPLLWSSVSQVAQVHWGRFNALNINPFKGLGGGGMHSAMLHLRALSSDIASWNVPGWSWSDVEAAYQSLEAFRSDDLHVVQGNSIANDTSKESEVGFGRGMNGVFPTVRSGCSDSLTKSFINASLSTGLNYNSGFNSPLQQRTGVGCYEVNIDKGLRVTAPKAFLHTYAQSRVKNKRLTLRSKALVRRVILVKELTSGLSVNIMLGDHSSKKGNKHKKGKKTPDSDTPPVYRAVGVEYELDDEIKYAYLSDGPTRGRGADARDFNSLRCVVLAAGAVMTPKLLMNSGVGPEEQLQGAGIEVKVASARVGAGLRDHVAVGLTFQATSNVASDFGSAYSFPQQWSSYTKAVRKALQTDLLLQLSMSSTGGGRNSGGLREGYSVRLDGGAQDKLRASSGVPAGLLNKPNAREEFGILGTNGISAGGFLVSPFAPNQSIADIQITLYPAVTEPHYVALMESKLKREAKGSQQGGGDGPTGMDFRNQILITASLLSPEAKFQVVLNATHALLGNPSIHPAHTSSSRSSSGGGGNAVKDPESPTTTESLADSFLGLFTSAPKSSPSEDTQMDSRMHSDDDLHQNPAFPADNSVDVNPDAAQQRLFHNNIVPAALSELDVRRLAWAVQKVRQIMSNMVEQGTIGKEVFPGASLQEVHGEATLPRAQQGSEVEDGGLHAWVRDNAFTQSNWVGSAAMGRSDAPVPAPAPPHTAAPATAAVLAAAGATTSDKGQEKARGKGSFRPTSVDNDSIGGTGGVSGGIGGRGGDDGLDDAVLDDSNSSAGVGASAMSVVDEELRVRNVVSLRVADASVIPSLPSGNVHATVLAVAWRAVDYILRL